MSKGTGDSEGIAKGAPPGKPGYEITLGKPATRPIKSGASFAKPPEKKPAKPGVGDSGVRETVETVVFVVVLVLLLKTFLAEAFVIPTGSMATTLLGYHLEVTCDKCGKKYLVNASSEAEPSDGPPRPVLGSWCENCQAYNRHRTERPGEEAGQ